MAFVDGKAEEKDKKVAEAGAKRDLKAEGKTKTHNEAVLEGTLLLTAFRADLPTALGPTGHGSR